MSSFPDVPINKNGLRFSKDVFGADAYVWVDGNIRAVLAYYNESGNQYGAIVASMDNNAPSVNTCWGIYGSSWASRPIGSRYNSLYYAVVHQNNTTSSVLNPEIPVYNSLSELLAAMEEALVGKTATVPVQFNYMGSTFQDAFEIQEA